MSRIILLHGASSAGKSSIAHELQKILETPFFHFSSDQLVAARILPPLKDAAPGAAFSWTTIRPKFFDGFHRCIKAFADAGNDLIVDHILEYPSWLETCVQILAGHRVFYVCVRCDLHELERREKARGDRKFGEARSHVVDDKIYTFSAYDFEIDSTHLPAQTCAAEIKNAFQNRQGESVFERLAAKS